MAIPSIINLRWVEHFDSHTLLEQLTRPTELALILVDVDNRIDFLTQLKVLKFSNIPVMALIMNLKQRKVLFQAGVHDYLLKPLFLEEVKTRLASYLQKKDIHEQDSNLEDRDRLSHQIIQNERLITIGRLITSMCHEITNRMQAAQGALSLALEEPDLSDDMQSFLSIGQQETRRVSKLVEMLRQTCRPELDPVAEINLKELLNEIRVLASDYTTNQKLTVVLNVSPDLPVFRGMAGQLQFAWLSLLLNLSDIIDSRSNNTIQICTSVIGPTVQIEFSTDAPLSAVLTGNMKAESGHSPRTLESALGMSIIQQVMIAHNGEAGCLFNDPGVNVWMSIPFT